MFKQNSHCNSNSLLNNNPLWLVDVGASEGIDARWENFTHHFRAVLFEPDPREYQSLKSKCANNFIVLEAALSDSAKEIDFHLCKKQQVSSVYLPNFDFLKKFPDPERFEVLKTIKVTADTLDHQLKKNTIAEIDFIKIDAQGYELPILRGSVDALERVIGLEVEVEFAPLYEHQPLFHEVDNFIRHMGFELFDLKRYFWKRKDAENYGSGKGQIIFGDALYFKSPEKILLMNEITEEKIIRSISIYLAYSYPDLAQTLLDLANSQGLLSQEKHPLIKQLLAMFKDRIVIPDFRGKRRIRRLLIKIAEMFSEIGALSGVDRALGNPPKRSTRRYT